MSRRRRPTVMFGLICILAGGMIILGMILPKAFWWFLLGVALIAFGVWLLRC